MHARMLNRIQTHDALRQLTFEAAFVTNVLDKLAAAQHLLFVHQLVAAWHYR